MAAVCALTRQTSAKAVTFAMCAFGAPWQKYTTLMYTAGFDAWLDVLRERKCEHSTHEKLAGGTKTKSGWNSNETAAYPPDFNSYLAQAAADLIAQRRSNISDPQAAEGPSSTDAAVELLPKSDKLKGSTFPPRPKAPAPAVTSVHPKAPAQAETLGDKLNSVNQTIKSVIDAADRATSIRQLSFADENISHEEPEVEELPDGVTAPPARALLAVRNQPSLEPWTPAPTFVRLDALSLGSASAPVSQWLPWACPPPPPRSPWARSTSSTRSLSRRAPHVPRWLSQARSIQRTSQTPTPATSRDGRNRKLRR